MKMNQIPYNNKPYFVRLWWVQEYLEIMTLVLEAIEIV